jgi:hypothetical protein
MIALIFISQSLIFGSLIAQAANQPTKTLSGSKVQSTKIGGISGSRPDMVEGSGAKKR